MKTFALLALALLLVACPNPSQTGGRAASPTFSPLYGNFSTDQSVTIASSTTGATIYYTTDGTDPTSSSPTYSSPIAVAGDGTSESFKALAVAAGLGDSAVAHASYTIHYPGTLDAGFLSTGTGASDDINTVAIQNDGKIIIGGNFFDYNLIARQFVARLSADGRLDTGFATGLGPDGNVYAVAVQKDGKILIGGSFGHYDTTPRGGIARLSTGGSLDPGFLGTGSGTNGDVDALVIQSDGKIIIGGGFSTCNGTPRGSIARLNNDGSLDTGFATGSGTVGSVESLAVQGDGRILIGGGLTMYNSTPVGHLARLNTDGSLDTGFITGTGADFDVTAIAVQNDGKILIGGYFTHYNSTPLPYLTRLNSDGSLDASFVTGTGPNFPLRAVTVQSDGKILIGGLFTSYAGTLRGALARLNSDGSLDTGFLGVGAGANSPVFEIAPQGDGKLLIVGDFDHYNGVARQFAARLWN